MDYVGRFENLADDFVNVCERLRIEPTILPHERKGSDDDFRDHYDEESIKLIRNAYREEIDLFEYSF